MSADEQLARVAKAIAKADGLDWDEVCGCENGLDECDSGTCVAALFEDHDPFSARSYYLHHAQAAIAALDAARGDQVAEVERLREENYRAFTDGMEAAAQICGSLAEVEYDDADGFDAATGCEAAIMRVVKDRELYR